MQIKIGILSAALISNDFVLSLKQLDPSHYKVVAVAANNLKSAQEFAKKHSIPTAYGSYEELAKDSEVQLVYIGNLNISHYASAKLCIENKKHVLVEKPMTIEVSTTKELYELGAKHGVFVMEALWARFIPAWTKVREILRSGQLGEILHISSRFAMHNFTDRIHKKKFGGGVTPDLGVYALNAIFEGVGYVAPTNVRAIGRLSAPGESEVSVSAQLDFPGLTTASLFLTALLSDSTYEDNLQQVTFVGTKGYIKIDDWINCPNKFEFNGKKVDCNIRDKETLYNWKNSYGLCHQFEHARKCIMNNKLTSDLHKPEHSLLLIETIRKIQEQVGAEVVDTPKDYNYRAN